MKLLTLPLLVGWVLVSQAPVTRADASSTLIAAKRKCAKCLRLREIAKLKVEESRKDAPDYTKLESEAASIVNGFGTKKTLSDEQISSFVEVVRGLVPVDPSRAIVEDTMPVILKNRAAIELKVKLLPKAESERLLSAIEVFALARKRGQDD